MVNEQFDLKERMKIIPLFQRFVLGRETENLRIKCYEDLILYALIDSSSSSPLSKARLIMNIQKLLGASNDMPERIITQSLQNLEKIEKIQRLKESYWISENIALNLREELKANQQEADDFYFKIAEGIKSKISSKDKVVLKDIQERVRQSITKIFEQRGLEVVQPLIMGKPTADTTDFGINNLVIELSFKEIENQTIVKAAKEMINCLFTNPDVKEAEFLYSLSKSYILLQALNLDPSCSRFQKEMLKQYILFIDSSVLLRAITKGGEFHEFYDTFLRTCSNLHGRIFIMKEIFDEVLHNVENAVQLYPWLSRNKLLMQEYNNRSERERNIFIDSFLRLKITGVSSKTWEEYIYEFHSHENPEKILKTIASEYKIEIFDTYSIFSQDDWKEIAWISDLITNQRLYEVVRRSPILADNEAKQFLLIYKKRKEERKDALGKLTWFITTDSIIPRVNLLLRKEESKFFIPCSYTPTKWYQFIELFARTARKAEVFTELLGSSMMRSIVPSIKDDLYQKFTEGKLPKTKEEYEHLIDIVKEISNDTHVRKSYEDYLCSITQDKLQKYEIYSTLAIDRFLYLTSKGFEEIKEKEKRILELEKELVRV
jgi:hypothetical protein